MTKTYTVLDIFCGAGGFSCGLEMHKQFKILAGIDNNKDALKTFQHNHIDSAIINYDLENVSDNLFDKLDTIIDKKIDLLIGGPPCQGFSIAGKRLEDDSRNTLWMAYITLVKKYKPKIIFLENVPTIMTTKNGEVADQIISSFEDMGYNVTTKIILSSNYGVPQNRKRAVFVATQNGFPAFNFPDVKNNKITTKEAIDDLPSLENDLGNEEVNYPYKPNSQYQINSRKNAKKLWNHTAVNHTQKTKDIISLVPDGKNYKSLPSHLKNTRKVNIAWTRMDSNTPCFTIDAGHNHHFHYSANRVPTVRECARMQSFPDTFIFLGTRTSQYRQVGNAVPPLVGFELAKSALEVLKNV